MACCIEFQNECNRIITIGYLKNFVGTVTDIDNNTVTVTGSNNKYCPTYQELTNGTYTKYYVNGKTGIQITGTYAANQNVRQKDLRFIHTEFKSLTVNSSKNPLNACGDSATLSPSYTFTQTTKYMDDNCNVTSTPTEISQSISNAITYTSSNSDFTISGNILSVGKNGGSSGGGGDVTVYDITPSDSTIDASGGNITFTATAKQVASQYIIIPSNAYQKDRYDREVWFGWDINSNGGGSITPASERSTIVTGHVTVNGIARTGNSSAIKQPPVSGGGASGTRVGYYDKPLSLEVISTDANGNPYQYDDIVYKCNTNVKFYAKGIGRYETYGSYIASDECGGSGGLAVVKEKEQGVKTEDVGVRSVTLADGCHCSWYDPKTSIITFEWGGFVKESPTYRVLCEDECSGCGGGDESCPSLTDNDGTTKSYDSSSHHDCDTVLCYGLSASSSDSWIHVTSDGSSSPDGYTCTMKFTIDRNTTGARRNGSISLSGYADAERKKSCSGSIRIRQEG